METNTFLHKATGFCKRTIPSLLIHDISMNDANDVVNTRNDFLVEQVTLDEPDLEIPDIEITTNTLLKIFEVQTIEVQDI